MPLIHDPSAIRYASTQEAYGTTWTLSKTEDDGAQVWRDKNGKEAIVQKAVEQVRSSHRQYQYGTGDADYGIDRINKRIVDNFPPLGTPVWTLVDFNNATVPVLRVPISDQRTEIKGFDPKIVAECNKAGATKFPPIPSIDFVKGKVRSVQDGDMGDITIHSKETIDNAITDAIKAKTSDPPAMLSDTEIANLLSNAYNKTSRPIVGAPNKAAKGTTLIWDGCKWEKWK